MIEPENFQEHSTQPDLSADLPGVPAAEKHNDAQEMKQLASESLNMSKNTPNQEELLTQPIENRVSKMLGVPYPIFCGAMYPSTNPELVLAVAQAGGMGVIQPVSFEKVHNWDFREALQYLKANTETPFGVNVIVRNIEKRYTERMENYVQVALEEGCRFFVTSLGDPSWVVRAGQEYEGVKVFHKVTNVKHARKAVAAGVDGLILVNDRAGGHLGDKSSEQLLQEFNSEFSDRNIPFVLAGGVGGEQQFKEALDLGYEGVMMGTRFIATDQCSASQENKNFIVEADEGDIVLTKRVDGVPLSVINTPFVERVGLEQPLYLRAAHQLVRLSPVFKPVLKLAQAMNIYFGMEHLASGATTGDSSKDYFQAGKSVAEVNSVEPAGDIIERFVRYYNRSKLP